MENLHICDNLQEWVFLFQCGSQRRSQAAKCRSRRLDWLSQVADPGFVFKVLYVAQGGFEFMVILLPQLLNC